MKKKLKSLFTKDNISDETLERALTAVYMLPIMALSTAYMAADLVVNCCEDGTSYTGAAIALIAVNGVYICYMLLRPYVLEEPTLVNLLDYDYFFTGVNLVIWIVGIAMLTFAEDAIFNDLNLGFVGTWGNFVMAVLDFFQTWDLMPKLQDTGHGIFTYRVLQVIFVIVAIIYALSLAIECYLVGNCDDGQDLATMFGVFSVVMLGWLVIFREDNPGRTYVALVLVGTWFIAVFFLTFDVPFLVDGKVVPNFFLMTWFALGVSFAFLIVSEEYISTKVTVIASPAMIIFAVCAVIVLVAQPFIITICEDLGPVVNDTGANLTGAPTSSPTISPSLLPSSSPSLSPTFAPLLSPTSGPSFSPTFAPTLAPTFSPTFLDASFDEKNQERCEIYQLALLGITGISLLAAGATSFLSWYYGAIESPHIIRRGCKVLLVIWSGAVFLTFPFASPVSLVSSGFLGIWFGYAWLLYFAFFSDELTDIEGDDFNEYEHYLLAGKAGEAFMKLQDLEAHTRYFLYVIFLGSVTHTVASLFAVLNEDLLQTGEERVLPEELGSLAIGITSLILLGILLCCFGASTLAGVKVALFLLWPILGVVPILIGPFDDLQGNGYVSTFITIGAVMALLLSNESHSDQSEKL